MSCCTVACASAVHCAVFVLGLGKKILFQKITVKKKGRQTSLKFLKQFMQSFIIIIIKYAHYKRLFCSWKLMPYTYQQNLQVSSSCTVHASKVLEILH